MINNINDESVKKCCGCGVCACICPKKAINLLLDPDGYFFAEVNNNCDGCGLCKKACFKYADLENEFFPKVKDVYVGYNLDKNIRYVSSSGGIGSALVKTAIENGYYVIGAYLDFNNNKLRHIIIKEENQISKICGSKYIPSYTVDAFSKIEELSKVMIIGTPCQIHAIKKAFSMRNKDLLLVDFRCFGPTGYNLFNKYIDFLNKKNPSGIKSINMRDKTKNWHSWGMKTVYEDGNSYYNEKYKDYFATLFNTYAAVHETCLKCKKYKNYSQADVRIEDAWHQMDNVTKDDYKNGLSQIAVFTQKGQEFFEKAKKYIYSKKVECDIHSVKLNNYPLPVKLLELLRDKNKTIEEVLNSYVLSLPLKKRLRLKIDYFLSQNRVIYKVTSNMYRKIKKSR